MSKGALRIELSGSDARRLMNGEALALWEEKLGRRQPEDLTYFLPAMIGRATEGVNRQYYKHKTGRQVYDPRPTGGVEVAYLVEGVDPLGIKLRSKFYSWMVGHVDGLVTEHDVAEWGVFESKHTGALSEWHLPEAVVEKNYWQGVHYCLLTGLHWIDFSCLYGLGDWQTYRIKPSEDDLTLLLGKASRFVNACLAGTPPEDPYNRIAGPPVDRKRAYTEKEVRSWACANAFAACASELVATWPEAERHTAAMKTLKELELPEDTKSVKAYGITVAIAKNGSKRVRLDEQIAADTAAAE